MGKQSIGMLIYANPDHYPPTINAVHLLSEQFDLVVIGRNQDIPDREYPNNVKIYRLGKYTTVREREQASVGAKLWEYICFVFQARHLLKQVSLVYAYDAFGYVAACICQLLIWQKVPLLYQCHETSEHLAPLSSLTGLIHRAERAWIHKAAVVVFPEKDRADFSQKVTNLPKEPLIVPNFPLKDYFKFSEDWNLLSENRWENITLFYRGSISDSSAMQETITAASLLDLKVNIKFVGFLTPANAEKLASWVAHTNISNSFTYLGTLPYKDLQGYTLASTIGFALYKNTYFDRVACVTACNKIYEYAACGLPVIVSNFPNYREYLGNESWVHFANPEDPHSIAIAVQDILRDFADYQAMCLAARRAFEEKYNYESAFSPLLAKINELIKDAK
jgi:glycosyltransferase involved in cell wall biosynthesis